MNGRARVDGEFLKGAEARSIVQLKGHRAVGRARASVYNAIPIGGVKRLVEYMKESEVKLGCLGTSTIDPKRTF